MGLAIKELKDYDKIVIVGLPGSGKTELYYSIKGELGDRHGIHTDDYMNEKKDNFEQSLYDMYPDVLKSQRHVVEGVQGYRLLRKGMERNDYQADLVIHCHCEKKTRLARYKKREGKEYKGNMDHVMDKVWRDYLLSLSLKPISRPRIIYFNTETYECKDHTWQS